MTTPDRADAHYAARSRFGIDTIEHHASRAFGYVALMVTVGLLFDLIV